MKRTMKLILGIMCALFLWSQPEVQAADIVATDTVGNISWSVTSDGVLSIQGTGAIPDNISPWTNNGVYSGLEGMSISKVTIGEGVTAIGRRNFFEMVSLKEVELPSTLTTIGDEAFRSCGISSIDLSRVKVIGKQAFYQASLPSISLTAATSIGDEAFYRANLPGTLSFS